MKLIGTPLVMISAAAVVFSSGITRTEAHSWLTKPVSREKDSYADEDDTVGCPTNTPGKSTSFKAGETIDVRYWRNNHLGGFIRWSMVPRGKESKANLDKSAFAYTCRESGPTCVPKGEDAATNMYADDDSDDHTISCGDKITLPDHLPAGDYVLQWTWFGVGSTFGNIGWAETMFRSCADIKLTTAGTKAAAPKCPTFVGGDRVTKMKDQGNDKCWYFYTTEIVNTLFKGSNTDYEQYYKFGVPAAIDKCGGNASPSNSTTPAPAAATKAPSTPAAPTATPKAPSTTTLRPMVRTPAPSSEIDSDDTDPSRNDSDGNTDDGGDDDSDNVDGDATSVPVPVTNAPGCKAKKSSKY